METLGKDVTLVSLLLTMNIFRTFSRAFITNFDQVNVYWVEILLGQKCLGKMLHTIKNDSTNIFLSLTFEF